MLVEDIRDILQAILNDYQRLGISALIDETANVLALKGTVHEIAYRDHSQTLRGKADALIAGENPFLSDERVRSMLYDSQFKGLLPSEIGVRLKSFLTDDVNHSAPSTEAQHLKHRLNTAGANYKGFIATSGNLNAGDLIVPQGEVSLTLRIPFTVFSSELAGLGRSLQRFDEFFSAVSEYATGKRVAPRINYASTSVLQIIMSVDPQTILHYMNAIKSCFEAAKSALDLRITLKKLRSQNLDKSALDTLQAQGEKQNDAQLIAALKLALQPSRSDGEARRNEIESRLISSSRYVVDKAQEGVTITIDRKVETYVRMSSISTTEDEKERTKRLMDDVTRLQTDFIAALGNSKIELLEPPESKS